ncbi:MAG TPA: HAMP domain-containing sensor histidine kinase [Solirubrobacter sp.]|nr:HAMP domain-containing sensor histidine kinase [Solirubrobacter sp.]
MARRLVPGGLRAQLALAIALVTAVALTVSFVAVYRGTGARLRDRIDADLVTQVGEWDQLRAGTQLANARDVERFARRFIDSQSYHPASRVFVIDVAGGEPVTNHPRILKQEQAREHENEPEEQDELVDGLLDAPVGLSDVSVEEAGRMRVLVRPIANDGRRIGTLYVADPLTPVSDAQASLLRTFALVGSLALALAVAVGVAIATLIARPLRRMAGVAAAVDSGDLSLRAGTVGARGEVGVLAGAFDHMLARLERAFARQRNFVSDASHELRTPLAVLRAQVELLDRESDEHARREGTRVLLRRLDELDRLVDDLLTLVSAEAGRLVQPRPIDLEDFFEDVRRDLPLFGERDFHVEPVAGILQVDPDRLTQVLRNLVRNAVAHTEPGGRVAVIAQARDGWLTIAVSDDGPGIPPEQLERVFERFHRVDEGRARERGGTGLGLAIARAIVEAHGGRIWAESTPGAGATIALELPGYRPAATGAGIRP